MAQEEKDGPGPKGETDRFAAPSISLPKGGGAIKGIGEKFGVNPVNGTGSMSVPIFLTPGRGGFSPSLSLSYNSGGGNSPFGFGWRLSHPSIKRKIDKRLPRYDDGSESDVFILSDAEDLVPVLLPDNGGWRKDTFSATSGGQPHTVHRYRPRVEGLFARIERWCNDATGETFWRSISKDNVTSLYGVDSASRIADPGDPGRVFSWLLSCTFDDRGNMAAYEYKAEDTANVPPSLHERNRQPSAQRYLKRVKYGNRVPYFPATGAATPTDWCFELVLDYGEHDALNPRPTEDNAWTCRPDSFSTYRSCFEIRTHRLCSRVLMFHHFPDELGTPDYLVRSTDLFHTVGEVGTGVGNPIYSYLQSIKQVSWRRQSDGTYISRAMPPLEFTYTVSTVDPLIRSIDPASLENMPDGVDGFRYQWVDLDGEGSPGVLSEQRGQWFYKRNISGLPTDDSAVSAARFEPAIEVASRPSLANLGGGGQQLMNLAGDGRLRLVQFQRPISGYFDRDEEGRWDNFRAFECSPNLDWKNPNLRTVDLDGDGFADILITEDEVLTWYPSLSTEGFGPARSVRKAVDEDQGPALVFGDGTQSIHLADASGDGLQDIVRVKNGEVCYWPNLGYGRFGAKIVMDDSPVFDHPDLFDQKRLRLADIDGTGTMDLIYLGTDSVKIWFNLSGNGFSGPRSISQFPDTDNLQSVEVVDLLGNGTACLVWSSPLPRDSGQPVRYIDLMGGQKPHLMIGVKNNFGAESRIQYAASTKFYLADRAAGRPWITRLSFPVHVVERSETFDWVSRNHFVSRYTYHHGYFDGIEREFRGFGMVEQHDTEELASLTEGREFPRGINVDASSYVPPMLTKTWFHTGASPNRRVTQAYASEYYQELEAPAGAVGLTDAEFPAMQLPATVLPPELTGEEAREAARALKGSMLRQEIYALDGTDAADRPYSVAEHNYTVKQLQPRGGNLHAVFLTHARESVDLHYERKLYDVDRRKLADPRVTHHLVLEVDEYGNELKSVAIGYGRRHADADPLLTPDDRQIQSKTLLTCTQSRYTNPVLDNDAYRTPLPAEQITYELIKFSPERSIAAITNLFRFGEMSQKLSTAEDDGHDLPYEDVHAAGAVEAHGYRRLIGKARTLYRKNNLSAPLPLGVADSMALPFEHYQLALTPGLLSKTFQRMPADPPAENLLTDPKAVLGGQGGFVDLDGDGHWWVPSGRIFHSPAGSDSADVELGNAKDHFFLPMRFENPFKQITVIAYDPHNLLLLNVTDAIGNQITAGERSADGTIINRNDYRSMHPAMMTDANGNRSAVDFDTFGLVAVSAVMGKSTETLGDSLAGVTADVSQADIDEFFKHPKGPAAARLLGNATTRIVYDEDRFQQTRAANLDDPTKWEPVFAATIARETHVSDLQPNQPSKLQVSFSYSDGFGREIQHKLPAGPGPLAPGGPVVTPRWVGSGWTVFNNKGKPVRQYEPFFDDTHDFTFGVMVGVSPILFYDPVGRVVATMHPNQTWEKVVFDPWRQESWDSNDTALIIDPRTDPDAGPFLERLLSGDYFPTWYSQRANQQMGIDEKSAAQKAAAHANTPTVGYFDTLGRTFLTVADNAAAGKYRTRTELDITGHQLSVTDALGRRIITYDYDLPGKRLHQNSVDAGERWMLSDCLGKPLIGWNSRGFQTRHESDALRRPTKLFVKTGSDSEKLAENIVYGESQPNDVALNLRGKAFQSFDAAGVVADIAYDFKGNLLSSSRQLLVDYKNQVDWSQTPAMESEVFTSSTTFDALNRPVTLTPPDGSVIRPIHNEANLLEQLTVNLQGAAEATPFVTNIDYNAKGQRELIDYGNGTSTTYQYDPKTFRLRQLKTTRKSDNAILQDLNYVYDPVGNITKIHDGAQQTIYFSNQVVTPDNEYVYDAIYRLITATGREHIGQTQSGQPTFHDGPRTNLPHPSDGQAMARYTERYEYDAVGNILRVLHNAPGNGWSQRYDYEKSNNRLNATSLPGDPDGIFSAPYDYDAHGNITQMPHLPRIDWNCKDELSATQQQVVNNAPGEETYYIYAASGQRVRKVANGASGKAKYERIYLGGFEVYRVYDGGETAKLERQTLHIMDDKQRVALVESLAKGSDKSPQQLFRYQFSNHLGSASLELSAAGEIIAYEEYWPYGGTSYQERDRATNAIATRYRFTGKERDEETGLYHHGERYYIPWCARWASCDPDGIRMGQNLYVYASNRPTMLIDPNGRADKPPPQLHLIEQFNIDTVANHSGFSQEGKIRAYVKNVAAWWGENPEHYQAGHHPKTPQWSSPPGAQQRIGPQHWAANNEQSVQEGSDRAAAAAKGLYRRTAGKHTGPAVPKPKPVKLPSEIESVAKENRALLAANAKPVPSHAPVSAPAAVNPSAKEAEQLELGLEKTAVKSVEEGTKEVSKAAKLFKKAAPALKTTGKVLHVAGKVAGAVGLATDVAELAMAKTTDQRVEAGIGLAGDLLMESKNPVAFAGGVGIKAGQFAEEKLHVSDVSASWGVSTYEGLKSAGWGDTTSFVAGGIVTVAATPAALAVAAYAKVTSLW